METFSKDRFQFGEARIIDDNKGAGVGVISQICIRFCCKGGKIWGSKGTRTKVDVEGDLAIIGFEFC